MSKSAKKILIGWAVLFAVGYLAWAAYSGALGNDFSIFWQTANLPVEAAYRQRGENPFSYPPLTLVWLVPLRLIGVWEGYCLWILLSTGGLFAAAWALAGRRVALLTLISPAVVACIAVGQIGNLAGLLVLLGASLPTWLGGALLGLAITIKPQLALAAPIILTWRRDWRALAACALAGSATLGAELTLFGFEPWFDWIRGLVAFHRVVVAVGGNAGSANPAGFAELLGLPIAPFWFADATLAAFLIASRGRSANPLELAAVIVLSSVFLSPYAIVYDLGAAMPFLASRALARRGDSTPFLIALICPWTSVAVAWAIVTAIRDGSTSEHVEKGGSPNVTDFPIRPAFAKLGNKGSVDPGSRGLEPGSPQGDRTDA